MVSRSPSNYQPKPSHPSTIIDKEIEIVHELGLEVLKYEDTLNSASDICGELDR